MADDQEILFAAKPSLRRVYFFAVLYAALVLTGRVYTDLDPRFNPFWWFTFGLLVVLLAYAHLRRWTTSYIITSDEIQSYTGILARRVTVVPVIRVTNAVGVQTFLERLLGLVNLQIDSAGGEVKEMLFTRILKSEGVEASRLIRELRHKNVANESSRYAMASGG